jgi:hypothetical protein
MKRITKESVWHLTQKDFLARKKARPFPGKAPTRIYLQARRGNHKLEYLGKPSPHVAQQFHKFDRKRSKKNQYWCYTYMEFDKGGLIAHYVTDNFQPLHKVHASLWHHYHPDVLAQPEPTWLVYRTVTKDHVYRLANLLALEEKRIKNAIPGA